MMTKNKIIKQISKYWPIIKNHLLPRQPRTLFYWKFILPNQTSDIQLHRKAFIKSLTRPPKPISGLFNLYSLLLWYVFFAWLTCYRIWKNTSEKHVEASGLNRWQQLIDLLTLSLVYCTPSQYYYRLRLYKYSSTQWLSFRFDHQTSHLHAINSPSISKRSSRLMADKHFFAKQLIKNNLPAIPTIALVKAGNTIDTTLLFNKKSLFLKPNNGSRSMGCYVLHYCDDRQQYSIKINDEIINEQDKITSHINTLCQTKDYLIQPLLKNTPEFGDNLNKIDLITIRLVTAISTIKNDKTTINKPEAISAILEVPAKNEGYELYIVNCKSGVARAPKNRKIITDKYQQSKDTPSLLEHPLPYWQSIIESAVSAHNLCTDITTIGWDIAITPTGVAILEGNINWGLTAHQFEGPMLRALFKSAN